ncbi:heavy-metal-associated domain-containing protein [Gaoshiqia sediminis]|uniref:Cation transporter n=1 Tax=Gaoshiqia sediminis TaxID=2986998 RepID=A0AA41Y7C3_9BACT|nr:cation transporter [Gaoshiqia sediminis]MCW0482437.1 cation transporter [Gaoshiqia sediminis]
MKSPILLLAFIFTLAISCGQKQVKESEAITPTASVELVYRVEGMTCDHCEMSIQKGVNELKGISTVEANHEDSTTRVVFDPTKTSEKEIVSAIEKRGYKVVAPSHP